MITPESFVAKTRELLDVRYVHQGRNPELGVDCIGVLVWPLAQLGYTPRNAQTFAIKNYRRYPDSAVLIAAMKNEADSIAFDDIQPGDILLMTLGDRTEPQHCALVSQFRDGVPYIIHTRETTPTVVEHWLDPESRKAVWGAYRLKEFSGS